MSTVVYSTESKEKHNYMSTEIFQDIVKSYMSTVV